MLERKCDARNEIKFLCIEELVPEEHYSCPKNEQTNCNF